MDPFGYTNIKTSVSSLLVQVADVVQSQGTALQTSLLALSQNIDDEYDQYKDISTFLVQDYYLHFLLSLKNSTTLLEESLSEEFACNISTPQGTHKFEKRYPLHVSGSQIQLFITLQNSGPGTAQDVRVVCLAEHCKTLTEDTRLGDVPPGPLVLTLQFEITHATDAIEIEVEVSWGVVGESQRRCSEFRVQADAQRTDLDWNALALEQPYSLDIAYGLDFYGRRDTLRRVLRRLSAGSMQSCFIAGQKRVGKSSLARAIQSNLEASSPSDYRVLYLECGEIRHSTGTDTLNTLGSNLEDFLLRELPRDTPFEPLNYSQSLAPLNKILDLLLKAKNELRFVVIIDEFDEINEELYRYGPLADTFFLNLRTISSKKNIAFVLVGAERMPYLMASQGEKLNRFEKESLDSFDQDTEWADYLALVRNPVKEVVEAHESALNSLFNLTYGHPYFTKMLCAAVYECAVEAKDAEVSRNEIEVASRRVVSNLDTNAFAHYWRDGIRGDADEIEIVSLKRCRVLLAWARTARANKPLTAEGIISNVHSAALPSVEVLPILEDFCRRGVLKEVEGCFSPTVRLFRDWLVDSGFTMLVADQLGDDLAEAKQKLEDDSHVHSNELVALTDRWELYQGREVTPEHVRRWLSQVESQVEQRLLFKILERVRFVTDIEVKTKFEAAHAWIRRSLPNFVTRARAQRRDDIIVTFVGGHGKSGVHYAGLYARANNITSDNVVSPKGLEKRLREKQSPDFGLVIVDDIVGTGNTLIGGIDEHRTLFGELGIGEAIPLSIVVCLGTEEGENKLRENLLNIGSNFDLEICETIGSEHLAFPEDLGFWQSEDEKAKAKTLTVDLGVKVQKRNPLGYGDQGLLVTFTRNCPNNTLPILHSSGKSNDGWSALFPRFKS